MLVILSSCTSCTMYSVCGTPYSVVVQCTPYSVCRTMYAVQCMSYSVCRTMYAVQCSGTTSNDRVTNFSVGIVVVALEPPGIYAATDRFRPTCGPWTKTPLLSPSESISRRTPRFYAEYWCRHQLWERFHHVSQMKGGFAKLYYIIYWKLIYYE